MRVNGGRAVELGMRVMPLVSLMPNVMINFTVLQGHDMIRRCYQLWTGTGNPSVMQRCRHDLVSLYVIPYIT
jgi:hypothetical protein